MKFPISCPFALVCKNKLFERTEVSERILSSCCSGSKRWRYDFVAAASFDHTGSLVNIWQTLLLSLRKSL